ncbi:protein translocase subunit SecF [Candidatus Uhrbacteria bacterium]|nr:protein translocase subunit SecF [Candidatus Uhrbacteria bacterium]
MKLPIIKHRNAWFLFSGLLVAASIIALVVYPLKLGIDFTGGSLLEVEFSAERPSPDAVTAEFAAKGWGETVVQTADQKGMLIRTKSMDEAAHQQVVADLKTKFGDVAEKRFESIGPTVGAELRKNAVWSLSLVLFAIAAYVAYAFRKVSRPVASWKYGLVTLIAALFHDVLLPLGLFAVLGRSHGVEVNSGIVAAVLTVLGFSVHDTIVVFDRIRENLLKTGGDFEEIVERSVNETLSRSINTSLTILLSLVAIFFWGGESLKYFSLTLIVGLIAGTYSSIFLASPLLVVFQKRAAR